jgi:hypothetical protein
MQIDVYGRLSPRLQETLSARLWAFKNRGLKVTALHVSREEMRTARIVLSQTTMRIIAPDEELTFWGVPLKVRGLDWCYGRHLGESQSMSDRWLGVE